MTVSESDRHELYARLEEVIGKEHTETIMSLLPPVGWADVATKHDLAELEGRLVARFEGRFERLDARFDRMEGRFDAIDSRFEAYDAKLEALESRVSASIFRTALLVNIPTILASFALTLTAVRLG